MARCSRFFKDSGRRVLGVDPAQEIAERTRASGIPTVVEFFYPNACRPDPREHGSQALITSNNVIAQ